MPTVSRYGMPQVQPQAAPNVRVNPNVPSGAFQPPDPVDLSGVGHVVAQIAQDERQKANEVATLDADNQLSDARNQLLYDPSNGILSAKGKNALDAAQGWQDRWTQTTGQIRQSLANDDQRLTFDRLAQGQYARANEEVESHVAAQRQVYEQGVVSSSLDLIHNDIVRNAGNPDVVAANIAKGQAIALDWSRRNGMSPEQTQDTVAKLTSTAHASVVEQLVNTGQDLSAVSYFQAHRDELTAPDLLQTERQVEVGSVRAESQHQADTILTSATTLGAALTAVRTIQDPRVRDATEERVRRGFADQAASDRDARNSAFDRASKVVMGGGGVDRIPVADRLLLSPDEFEQLDRTAARIRSPSVTTAPSYYTHWSQVASLHPEQFYAHDFGADRVAGRVSEEDYRRFTDLQRTLREHGDRLDESAANRQKRQEESNVIRQSVGAIKYDATAGRAAASIPNFSSLPDSVKQKFLAGFGQRPRVTVPRWMVDSTQATPQYLDHLRLSGVDVDAMLAAPKGNGPVTLAPPKAPGAPIPKP